jgi:hypothetical protein
MPARDHRCQEGRAWGYSWNDSSRDTQACGVATPWAELKASGNKANATACRNDGRSRTDASAQRAAARSTAETSSSAEITIHNARGNHPACDQELPSSLHGADFQTVFYNHCSTSTSPSSLARGQTSPEHSHVRICGTREPGVDVDFRGSQGSFSRLVANLLVVWCGFALRHSDSFAASPDSIPRRRKATRLIRRRQQTTSHVEGDSDRFYACRPISECHRWSRHTVWS